MDDRPDTHSRTARHNRRGCFLIAAVLVLLIAALAYIGFRGDPMNTIESTIPVQS